MNIQETIANLPSMLNDIGIVGDMKLARLIGYHSDPCDSYYHVRYFGGEESYFSMVGSFISLKGIERYTYMNDVFELNSCPKSPIFLVSESNELPYVFQAGEELE